MGWFTDILENLEAPGVTMLKTAGMFYDKSLPIKKYVDNLTNITGKTTVSLDELSPGAKTMLGEMIKKYGEGNYDLSTKNGKGSEFEPEGFGGFINQAYHPFGELKNTFGAFDIKLNKETGEFELLDKYDWDIENHKDTNVYTADKLNKVAKIATYPQQVREFLGVEPKEGYVMRTGVTKGMLTESN